MTQGKGPPDSSHLQDARVHYTVPKQQPHTPATTPPTKAARPRQTQDKHRNTKNPATQEEKQPTITTPTPQGQHHNNRSHHPPGTEACCLKTQQHAKPYKPHNTTTAFPTPQQPKGSSCCVLTSNNTMQPQPVPHTHHTTPQRINQACMLSSTEFIDIPPMSNPPVPHSGTDMGNHNNG